MKASPLRRAALRTLAATGLPAPGEAVISALSGGPDSVALLDVLDEIGREKGFSVVAAHLDHGLRAGSSADAAFCRELCRARSIPLETERVDVRACARRARRGIEEAARRERYAFLRRVRQRLGAVRVAVGHTSDDQVETVLMRLMRGSGGQGLGAMRARRGRIVRPLLTCSRREVLDHLAARGLTFREDASNADTTFVRNRVRHELIPYLEARFNPRVREALARTAGLLSDEQKVLRARARALVARAGRVHGQTAELSRGAVAAAPRAVARLALRRAVALTGGLEGLGLAHVERILDLARSQRPSGKRLALPGGREVVFRFDRLVIRPRTRTRAFGAIPLPVPGSVTAPGGWTFTATPCGQQGAAQRAETHVDIDVAAGLVVRTRRPGDRLRLRDRVVSLKRYLGQARVPFDERGELPLVASGGTVVWLPGLAPDVGGCGPRRVHLSVGRLPQAALGVTRRDTCAGEP